MSSRRVFIHGYSAVNALGASLEGISPRLFAGETNRMRLTAGWRKGDRTAHLGQVWEPLPEIHDPRHQSRNNQLLLMALAGIEETLQCAVRRYGSDRIAVVVGTSTSGIAGTEDAILGAPAGSIAPEYMYSTQEFSAPAEFLSERLGVSGPAYAISTACTSSTRCFITARRLLRQGMVDAVIVAGADSLCKTTVEGFCSLEAVSPRLTNPMSLNRDGINIGEAAGVFLLSREQGPAELLGAGESCDAHHLSAPEPGGRGAEIAIRMALADAGLTPADIGYVNLHGTGTRKNDEMESHAMRRVFPDGVLCSSTKPLTGHTLGAAGATEVAFCCLALADGRVPPHRWDSVPDLDLPALRLASDGDRLPAGRRVCMSNNFAFGGDNVSLILAPANGR
jgi:3-oxoacyl-[acyl-carrier-protein] synthase-1